MRHTIKVEGKRTDKHSNIKARVGFACEPKGPLATYPEDHVKVRARTGTVIPLAVPARPRVAHLAALAAASFAALDPSLVQLRALPPEATIYPCGA